MIRKTHLLAVSCLGLLFSTFASANNFSYNSLGFRLAGGPTTYGVEMNLQFMENAHYILRADSEFDGDWDIAGGVGFNGPANEFADVYGHMILHNIKDNSGDFIGDTFVPEFSIGGRTWFAEGIELHGKLGQLIGGNSTHFIWEAGGRFHSTEQLVLGASLLNNGAYGNQFMMTTSFSF